MAVRHDSPNLVDNLRGKSAADVDDEGNEQEPFWLIDAMQRRPAAFCFCNCCGFFLFMPLFLFAVTDQRVYLSTDIPFYVYGHQTYERMDAVVQARITAMGSSEAAKPSPVWERSIMSYELKVLYEVPYGSNIWNAQYLRTIADIEAKIISARSRTDGIESYLQAMGGAVPKPHAYNDSCLLKYDESRKYLNDAPSCATPVSIIGFLAGEWLPLPFSALSQHSYVRPESDIGQGCVLPAVNLSSSDRTFVDSKHSLVANMLFNLTDEADFDRMRALPGVCGSNASIAPNAKPSSERNGSRSISGGVHCSITNRSLDNFTNASTVKNASSANFSNASNRSNISNINSECLQREPGLNIITTTTSTTTGFICKDKPGCDTAISLNENPGNCAHPLIGAKLRADCPVKCNVCSPAASLNHYSNISNNSNVSSNSSNSSNVSNISASAIRTKSTCEVLRATTLHEVQKMAAAHDSCGLASALTANRSCDDARPCVALLNNTLQISRWGVVNNKMWEYGNVTPMELNLPAALRFWAHYGGAPQLQYVTMSPSLGNYWPFIYGVAADVGQVRRLLPQRFKNFIRDVADDTFGLPHGGKTGRAFLSTFYFGRPVVNVDQPAQHDSNFDQRMKFGHWAHSAFHDLLREYQDKRIHDLSVVWTTRDIQTNEDPLRIAYSSWKILWDLLWFALALLWTWVSIFLRRRSIVLATSAIVMLALSVLPTFSLYKFLLQQSYVGILQLLSAPVILSAGGNAVFVLLDTYDQEKKLSELGVPDFSAVSRHARKATFFTSTTACCLFLSTAFSSFPAMYILGLWGAVCVVVNFCSANIFYLSVVVMYEGCFAKNPRRCCACRAPQARYDWHPTQEIEVGPDPREIRQNTFQESKESKEGFTGVYFFSGLYYPRLSRLRLLIVLIWLALNALYVVLAARLTWDDSAISILPAEDPYATWRHSMATHFSATQSPNRVSVQLVFGLDSEEPLVRKGTDPAVRDDRGSPNWGLQHGLITDAEWNATQGFIVRLCHDLRHLYGDESLKIARPEDYGDLDPVKCPWTHLQHWALANQYTFPAPTKTAFSHLMQAYLASVNPQDPTQKNFEVWQDSAVWKRVRGDPPLELKMFLIHIELSLKSTAAYTEGMEVWKAWESFVTSKRVAAGYLGKAMFVTDNGSFHHFMMQETITKEFWFGIGLALGLAYGSFICFTRNAVMATIMITSIGSMFASLAAFVWLLGWKVGCVEMMLFLLALGMSADYVILFAEAYLDSPETSREKRTMFMLAKVGMTVLSGGLTTIGVGVCMCFTHIATFQKCGLIVAYNAVQALITCLLFFSALLSLIGPEGDFGAFDFGCAERSKGPQVIVIDSSTSRSYQNSVSPA